jgi:hypothetical protein
LEGEYYLHVPHGRLASTSLSVGVVDEMMKRPPDLHHLVGMDPRVLMNYGRNGHHLVDVCPFFEILDQA